MGYSIVVTSRAKKDIDSLEVIVRKRLGKKLSGIAQMDDVHTLAKHLQNSSIGMYRIRIGDYRVVFDLDDTTMVILRVQHRKDVYRRL